MDDEELDQGGQKGKKGGRSNPLKNVENRAKSVQKGANKRAQRLNKSAQKSTQKAAQQSGKKAAKSTAKAAKKAKKAEKAAKVASKAGKVASSAAKLGSIIGTVGIILIIVIAIIAILVFIITGMGLILSGLKEIASAFGNGLYNFCFNAGDNFSDEKIVQTMEYIDEMGYDLFEYGFVSSDAANKFEESKEKKKEKTDNDANNDDTDIPEDVDDVDVDEANKIKAEDRLINEYSFGNFFKDWLDVSYTADEKHYRNILAYLYSDNYAYLLRNTNLNLGQKFQRLWSNDLPKTGLIGVYHDNGIGKKGDPYGVMEPGSIEVDSQQKKLVINKGWIGAAKIEYSLDGWTGRYSMPLEFLLSTHIATMAPDFTYKMAQRFTGKTEDASGTEVEILLHDIDDENNNSEKNINAAVIPVGKDDSDRIERKVLADANDSIWTNVWDFADNISFNGEEALKVLKETKLESYMGDNKSYKCTGPVLDENIGYNNNTNLNLAGDEIDNYVDEKLNELINSNSDLEMGQEQIDALKTQIIEYVKKEDDYAAQSKLYQASVNKYAAQNGSSDSKNFRMTHTSTSNNYVFTLQEQNGDKKITINVLKVDSGNDELVTDITVERKDRICNAIEEEIGKQGYVIENTERDKIKIFVFNIISASDNMTDTTVTLKKKPENNNNNNNNNNQSNNSAAQYTLRKNKDFEEIVKYKKKENRKVKFNVSVVRDGTRKCITELNINLIHQGDPDGKIKNCSDPNNTATTACDECERFVTDIYKAMNEIKVKDLQTYIPYINQVTDHWFRDVYFTKEAAEGKTVIETDKEYEKKTGERWTLYELDNKGNYELYVYKKKDGEYQTKFATKDDKYIVCQKVDNGGSYKLNEDGITYKKQDKGGYELFILDNANAENKDKTYSEYTGNIEEFRVGKKAETADLSDWEGAYSDKIDSSAGSWEDVDMGKDDAPAVIKDLNETGIKFQYQLNMGKINQVNDAVRGETNPDIKKLFLDEYYIYDGTESKALLIDAAKELVKKENESLDDDKKLDVDDPDSFRKLLKDGKKRTANLGKAVLKKNGKIETISKASMEFDVKGTIDEISGPINLTHDALTAFSILENMHTLDAEYIYHDFKELIVELNYFDKEDLVEPEDEVLMFPISGVSAAGWPVTRYDKGEDFYGTLIHSAEDLKANRKETEVDLVEEYGYDSEVDDIDAPNTPANTESKSSTDGLFSSEQSKDGSCNRIVKANGIEYKQFAQGDYTAKNNDGHSIAEGGCGICSTAGLLTGYGYDVDPNKIVKKKKDLGLKWYPDNGQRAGNIQKILKSYGIEGEWKKPSSLEDIKKVLHDALDNGIPVIIREAKGGQIWHTEGGHYFGVVGQDSDGKLYTVDSATKSNISRLVNDGGIDALANDINGHLLMIFVPNEAPDGTKKTDSGTSSPEPEFEGYAGSTEDAPEYVLAPATGEVIKYGTVKRNNKYTGQTDNVGFIKIRLLGDKEAKFSSRQKGGCTKFGKKSNLPSFKQNGKNYFKEDDAGGWLEAVYDKEKDKVGYDYFWTEYIDAGIADNVVYLEGFDVSEILGNEPNEDAGKDKENIKDLYNYIVPKDEKDAPPNSYSTSYQVPSLLDKNKEFELKIEEEAKKQAVYALDKNGTIYIKEGAVIGKTFSSDPEENGGITKETKVEIIDTKAEEKKKEDAEKNGVEMSAGVVDSDGNVTYEEGKEENEVATKKKKYNLGNYMRIILRDTKDEVVENVEDFVEIPEGAGGGSADIYGTQLLAGNTIEIPPAVLAAQEGYSISFEAINRQELGMAQWSDNTVQRAIYEEWKKQGSVAYNGEKKSDSLDKGLAIITINGKDYVPVAVKTTFGNPGDYIQIVFEDGTMLDCVIADAKGTDSGSYIYNGLDYGHSDGTKCNILEVLIKGKRNSSGSYDGGLNKDKLSWWGKKVVKITNGGSVFTKDGPAT